jgi:hypothetical protein
VVPEGASDPCWLEITRAVKLTGAPICALEREEINVVKVESLLIDKASNGLLEPIRSEPCKGVKAADSCAGELAAPNDVPHVTLIWRRVCQGGRLRFRREAGRGRGDDWVSQEGGTSGSVTALPV